MTPASVRRLLALYPRAWRERYGEEFAALLESHPTTLRIVADVIGGAIAAQARAVTGRSDVGHAPAGEWWISVAQDIRYAMRGIRLKPGFATSVVLTLALGIGANAAMFGIVDRLLFRPPAYLAGPDRASRIYTAQAYRGKEEWTGWFGYRRYLDFREVTRSFDAMTPFEWGSRAVGDGDGTHLVEVASSAEDLWRMFDVRPVIGRFFTAAENNPVAPARVAVLSYGCWQAEYGGQPDILGKSMHIGSAQYTIIGVAPEGFAGFANEPICAFVPMSAIQAVNSSPNAKDPWYASYSSSWFKLYARRRPGVSVDAATADLTEAFRKSYLAEIASSRDRTPIEQARPRALAAGVLDERGPERSSETKVAMWLAGVALIVLLIACVNVTNLLVGRALRRRREIAVRLALGVSRGRLVRQLLTETLLFAVLGGAAGLAIGQFGGAGMRRLLVSSADHTPAWTDGRVIGYAAVLVVLAGLLTGIAPVLQTRRTDVASALKSGAREGTARRSRLRTALLVLQASLSVVLLVGAGLFVRSLSNVEHVRLGYDADRLLWVGVYSRGVPMDSARQVSLRRDLLAAAQRVPGVENASRALTIPFASTWSQRLFIAGIDSVNKLGEFTLQASTSEIFSTFGTRILRGRGFTIDGPAAPHEMVVTQSMAKRIWPNEDALGKCVRVSVDTAPCMTVVGISEDVRRRSLSKPEHHYYMPIDVFQPRGGGLFVRTHGRASDQKAVLQRALQPLMPGASYVTVTPFSENLNPQLRSWRLGAMMFSVFGGLAMLLAAIGLYSVIAHDVTQRMHEMGVRAAVGALPRNIIALVLRDALGVVTPGLLVGVLAALAGGRWIEPLLFEQSPRDPFVLVGVVAVLMATAFASSVVPARRAARVDPSAALRTD
jgi:predicted permease